tara:strand:+ start:1022 stop:1195 length:174 start_codon:yes stop_codon:yes gene_type:complete
MTTLLYRGLDYVKTTKSTNQKACIELTYRQKHYNTCRAQAKADLNSSLTYRGVAYNK